MNLNDIDLAQDQFRFHRDTPFHSNDLFPLRPPLRPSLRPPLRPPLRPSPRCPVVRPHIPDKLVLLDTGFLPAGPLPHLGFVLRLHSRVAGILVHSLQSTNVAL